MNNYLTDKEFLKKLDNTKEKRTYIRIISLDNKNNPLEMLEGRATGGSVNLDGTSAVRRSCSLSLIAFEDKKFAKGQIIPITDVYWGLKNRFKLEVGVENLIEPKYPDIIWFKQGHFVINSFSKSININGGINISISGQDKMAMLNGTLGGQFLSEIDFGTEEEVDEWGNVNIHKIPIYNIIKNALQVYAQEPLENIVINDLDEENAWELWDYRGETPMYIIGKIENDNLKLQNITLDGDTKVFYDNDDKEIKISEIPQYYSLNTLDPSYNEQATSIAFEGESNKEYKIIKIEYGETAGYHATDLVYNTDLILKPGETITSLLDKLKNMLSNFEYFYDINGRFVFQKKKDYIQELFSPIDGSIINPTMITSPYEYKFEDTKLFTAISNSPKIDNVKNDFVVWGSKKSGSNDIPFHARCAIHKKPQIYTTQPYYEKRKLTYLQRIPYTSGKPFVQQENGSFRIEYNEIFDVNPSHIIELIQEKDYESLIPFIIPKGRYIMKITTDEDLGKLFNAGNIKLYGEKTNGQTTLSNLINTFQIVKEENNYILSSYIYTHEKNYNKLFLELPSEENIESFTIKWYPATKKYNLVETDNNSKTDDNLYYLKNQIYWKNIDELYSNQTEKNKALPNEPGTYYNLIPSKTYKIKESSCFKNQEGIETEWQEIIYQMAIDYYRHNMESDFLNKLDTSNIYKINESDVHLYPNGKTGYEQYYQDLQAFWRLLYNPEAAAANYCSLTYEFYPKDNIKYKYWNKYIHSDPSKLPYWLEFLDLGGAELSKYSISEIGQRPKVVNENNINSIYYKEIPEVQFVISPEEVVKTDTSYTPLQIQKNMEALFSRSSQGLSAIEKINELLYQHSYCSEGLSLTSIPIWYLQPNTRIYVEGQGDYTLDRIQYNLNYNGTMNLTCTKVIKQIF